MCTVMLVPETLQAQMTPAAVARKQVDELIRQEQDAIAEFRKERRECKEMDILAKFQEAIAEFRKERRDRNAMPPVPAGDIFVWFDRACYGNGGKGYYYVRFHSGRWCSTAYDHPALIVKKSKLRPDQIAFMERKCRETEEEAQEYNLRVQSLSSWISELNK